MPMPPFAKADEYAFPTKRFYTAKTHKRHGDNGALYSITSSVIESRLSEILTPSVFAVLRLMTNSNLTD
jgi:hypothetical protein